MLIELDYLSMKLKCISISLISHEIHWRKMLTAYIIPDLQLYIARVPHYLLQNISLGVLNNAYK